MKTHPLLTATILEYKMMGDILTNTPEALAAEEVEALALAIDRAKHDDEVKALQEDYRQGHPHYFKEIVKLPRELCEAAFGSAPTLAAQGAITKRYGQASAESAARSWGTSLGSLKPGRDPDASGEKSTKKAAPSGDAPSLSKNPWADGPGGWRAPRPPKDEADRQRMRLAAQTEIIKNFGAAGATRYARSAGKQINGLPLRVKS